MPTSRFEKFLPIAGILAGILFAASMFTAVVPDDYAAPDALQMMQDNRMGNYLAAYASGLCAVAVLFFATAIRQALRSGEGGESSYSSAAFAGGILIAAARAVDGWFLIAGTHAAEQADPAALNTILYLGLDGWMPTVAGLVVFYLAAGLGGLRTRALPTWLSIAAIALGVLCLLGPAGQLAFLLTPLWLILTGIVLSRRHSTPHSNPQPQAASTRA